MVERQRCVLKSLFSKERKRKMAFTNRSPNELTFKHAKYTFAEDIILPLAVSYVPDWDLAKATKESLQNAYDEAWLSDSQAFVERELDGVYLRDNGRGVHWANILVIGDSGKRQEKGTVGTHGEGEIISFLVAARDGIRKWMASQDWLLEGRIGKSEYGQDVLILARYQTASGKARKGTRWYYANPGTYGYEIQDAFDQAQDAFANHAAVTRNPKRIFRDYTNRQCLMTNGQKVITDYHIILGYNLMLHPGRDRATFSLADPKVREEIQEILETQADAEDIAVILREGRYSQNYLEFELPLHKLDREIVKKAVKILENENYTIVWAQKALDAAKVADAKERGGCNVLLFDSVPDWVRDGVPHVSSYVKSFACQDTKKRMPKDFSEAVSLLLQDVYRIGSVQVEMHNPLPEGVIADANYTTRTIRFDWHQSKEMSMTDLFETIGHELAHIQSCAEDCTRAHTDAMGTLMARAAKTLMDEKDAQKAWHKAETRVKRYSGQE
jgi:hypothetical protein